MFSRNFHQHYILRPSERLIDEMTYTESRLKGELTTVKGKLKLSVPSAMTTKLLANQLVNLCLFTQSL